MAPVFLPGFQKLCPDPGAKTVAQAGASARAVPKSGPATQCSSLQFVRPPEERTIQPSEPVIGWNFALGEAAAGSLFA